MADIYSAGEVPIAGINKEVMIAAYGDTFPFSAAYYEVFLVIADEERAAMNKAPFDKAVYLKDLGVNETMGEKGAREVHLPVPHRRWRNFSQGEKRILSASRPISTMTSMIATTCSMAWSSRP